MMWENIVAWGKLLNLTLTEDSAFLITASSNTVHSVPPISIQLRRWPALRPNNALSHHLQGRLRVSTRAGGVDGIVKQESP